MVGFAVLTAAVAWLIKPAVDLMFVGKNYQMLFLIPIAVALVYLGRGFCDYGTYYLMNFVGQSVIRDLRERMFIKLEEMSVGFFVRHTTGELLSRLNNDVALVQGAVTSAVTGIVKDGLTVIFLICVCFYMDYVLAMIAMVVFPIAFYPLVILGRRLKRYSKRMLVSMEDITERLDETISGIRIVKAFAMEDYELARFNTVNQTLFNAFMRRFKVRALSSPVMETLGGFGAAAVLFYGGYQVLNGASTPGTFFSFLGSVALMYEHIKKVNEVNLLVQEGLAAGERMFPLLDEEPDVQDRPGARKLDAVKQAVIFDDVSFSYGSEAILRGISLEVKVDECVAIVGESGVGKSTLLDLLPRFYDVTGGRILIDGVDVRDFTQRSLREKIGIVTQQTILFDDTIRNNIAYGRPDLPLETVMQAARAAHAHDFIMALPDGYDSLIGENGIKLSGGERQRIAIARALLKDPPILILDEATSNLDADSERAVQQAIEELMKGRTTLVVAHRLSTIRNADRIYVLKGGRVAEKGSHDMLLALDGEFARLYHMQLAPQEPASEIPSGASSNPV
jgi:subfamily B ATP-binding cassette protein MsbA